MEHDDREPLNEAEERLRGAWRAQRAPEGPADFRQAVMRDVRAAATSGARPGPVGPVGPGDRAEAGGTAFAHAVRIGAIAAGLLAVAAGIVGAVAGVWPSGDVYALMKSQPASLVEWLLVL